MSDTWKLIKNPQKDSLPPSKKCKQLFKSMTLNNIIFSYNICINVYIFAKKYNVFNNTTKFHFISSHISTDNIWNLVLNTSLLICLNPSRPMNLKNLLK